MSHLGDSIRVLAEQVDGYVDGAISQEKQLREVIDRAQQHGAQRYADGREDGIRRAIELVRVLRDQVGETDPDYVALQRALAALSIELKAVAE